ncbi:hypothetical protein HII31_04103 [Pseudocercospora fuligena]|uniref:Allergen n=1 Tax=Pseudocercospora fuligena TaxID=685502 RepID=A0A8H6RP44_9PEZI|nr:hypothetical protein HII31_04103 [Pseudocercospora fuligena]
MQAAKDAVNKFTSKHGHHDTTVHEKVAPSVQNETVTRNQEDRVTTAIDKEVHQDHYHTSVQPVHDKEVLPEKHHHNLVGVEHRNFEHDDHSKVKSTLDREAAKFKDTTERVEGQHTTTAQPTAAGEHVHHHVHETIQPVVNKQTIEPHVVHTTVPIHEVHHNAAEHHATSQLPAVSMADYKKQGGALTGRDERSDAFDGCPKPIGGSSDDVHKAGAGITSHGNHSHGTSGVTGSNGVSSRETTGAGVGSGVAAGGAAAGADKLAHNGVHNTTSNDGTHGGYSGNRYKDLPDSITGRDSAAATSGGTGGVAATGEKNSKPSLIDRLNPMKDTDGDGKKGIMD